MDLHFRVGSVDKNANSIWNKLDWHALKYVVQFGWLHPRRQSIWQNGNLAMCQAVPPTYGNYCGKYGGYELCCIWPTCPSCHGMSGQDLSFPCEQVTVTLPMLQSGWSHPGRQSQRNLSVSSWHVPEWWQGSLWHSSTSEVQRSITKVTKLNYELFIGGW